MKKKLDNHLDSWILSSRISLRLVKAIATIVSAVREPGGNL
jgi:hypothetical protein